MLTVIPDLLAAAQVAELRGLIDAGAWSDGAATAGAQSALAKRNTQLPEASDAARQAGARVLDALSASPVFVAAALPLKVYPPLFNRYVEGDTFGAHVDGAMRIAAGSDFRVRADVAATVFLSDPAEYDGGELVIVTQFGEQRVKLPAGQLVLYPASSLHHVTPITRGQRVASVFWAQSMVRSAEQRALLFDLDTGIQSVAARLGQGDGEVVRLTGVYHNLLRQWAEL